LWLRLVGQGHGSARLCLYCACRLSCRALSGHAGLLGVGRLYECLHTIRCAGSFFFLQVGHPVVVLVVAARRQSVLREWDAPASTSTCKCLARGCTCILLGLEAVLGSVTTRKYSTVALCAGWQVASLVAASNIAGGSRWQLAFLVAAGGGTVLWRVYTACWVQQEQVACLLLGCCKAGCTPASGQAGIEC
jgi:hypothetical protein